MTRDHAWPGEPGSAWNASAGRVPDKPLDRPPDISTFEAFRRHVKPHRGYLFITAFLVLMAQMFIAIAVAIGSADLVTQPVWLLVQSALYLTGAGIIVWGLVFTMREYRDEEKNLRETYVEGLENGIVARGSLCRVLRIPGADGWDLPELLIDVRLDDARATRLRAAFDAWFERLRENDSEREAAEERFGSSRKVLPSEELFGPEAAGGWLRRSVNRHSAPWRLFIPERDENGRIDVRARPDIRTIHERNLAPDAVPSGPADGASSPAR